MISRRTEFTAAGLLAAAMLVASSSAAQGPTKDATTLFKEGLAAMEAKNYDVACPKFEEVVQIKPGLGARIALGDCYRERGDVVRAYEVYEAVATDAPDLAAHAPTDDEQKKAQSRGDEAKARLALLESQVGGVIIEVPNEQLALPGFSLRIDGTPLPPEKVGKPKRILPGKHVVEASATGFVADKREVVARGASEPAVVRIELIAEKPAAIPADKPVEKPADKPPENPVDKPADKPPTDVPGNDVKSGNTGASGDAAGKNDKGPQPPGNSAQTGGIAGWAWGAGAVGIASLGAAVGFALDYRNTRNAAARDCRDGTCNEPGLASEYEDRWNRDAALMATFGGVGAVGATLFLVGAIGARGNGLPETKPVGFSPWFAPGGGGMVAIGSF